MLILRISSSTPPVHRQYDFRTLGGARRATEVLKSAWDLV